MNTLGMAKQFEEGGFSHQQAETLSMVFPEFFNQNMGNLVTNKDLAYALQDVRHEQDKRFTYLDQKIDAAVERLDAKIEGVEQRLDARIEGVEQRLDHKIEQVAHKLTVRLGSLMVGLFGIFFGLTEFFALYFR